MIKDVDRYGQPVVSQLVYDRTKEQRDFWKERAEGLQKANAMLIARVERLRKIVRTAQDALDGKVTERETACGEKERP